MDSSAFLCECVVVVSPSAAAAGALGGALGGAHSARCGGGRVWGPKELLYSRAPNGGVQGQDHGFSNHQDGQAYLTLWSFLFKFKRLPFQFSTNSLLARYSTLWSPHV